MSEEQESTKQEIKVRFPEQLQGGSYSNVMNVVHTKEEFVMDFMMLVPPVGTVTSRIIMSPGHMKRMVAALQENIKRYDVVLAYRKLNKNMPFVLKFGNTFINKTISFLYGIKIKDSQCGYRAFTAKAYKKLKWKATDYSMESEIIAKIGKYKLSYMEVPIETIYSDKYKGTTVLDGIKIVFNLLLWRLNNI